MDGCSPSASVAFQGFRLVSLWFQMGKLVSTRSRNDILVSGSFCGKIRYKWHIWWEALMKTKVNVDGPTWSERWPDWSDQSVSDLFQTQKWPT